MANRSTAKKSRANSKEISVRDAEKKYRGKWILMQVTRTNERGDPAAGVVLIADPDRAAISRVFRKLPPRAPGQGPYYIFASGAVPPSKRGDSVWVGTFARPGD